MRKTFFHMSLPSLACFLVPLALVWTSLLSLSCKLTPEGIVSSMSDDVRTPVLASFFQDSADSLSLVFSELVVLSNLEVCSVVQDAPGELVVADHQIEVKIFPKGNGVSVDRANNVLEPEEGGGESLGDSAVGIRLEFTIDKSLEPGKAYVLSGVAHDQDGNSLLFQLPFHGYNGRVAGVVLSEVRSGYSKPKVEYLEFYVYKKGNLAGINLYTANKDFEYVFPPVEVEAGDYVVLHMRALESETGRVDEVGSNLNLSTATGSCQDARDLWVSQSKRIVGTKDAIVLRERFGGKIMDSLLYIHPDISDAEKKRIVPIAQQVLDEGAWSGSTDFSTWASGEDLSETATTRSLSRQNIAAIVDAMEAEESFPVASKDDWFVVAKSSATPGLPNSSNRFVAK